MPLRFLLLATVMAAAFLPAAHAARVGLLLGTFDPPHLGITRMVEEAASRLQLDTVYLVPTPLPIDRPEVTPVEHRLAMLRLLAPWIKGVIVPSEADLTVIASRLPDNLFAALRDDIMSQRPPQDEIFQIVGEDALPKLVARKQLPVAGERRFLAVFPRKGTKVFRTPALDALEKSGLVIRLDAEIPGLASSDLRARMKSGTEADSMQLSEAIRAYIRREGLYGLRPVPLTREILNGFTPTGYLAKPVLLHGPTTDTSFVPAHLESFLEPADQLKDQLFTQPGPDFPPALKELLQRHVMQVVLFQSPTTDALDWLETQGWRTLHGFVPPTGDDRPMLFFGRRGNDWTLFVTGIFSHDRFKRLAKDFRNQFASHGISSMRLTVLGPARP